jgi:flagellar motor switch protein FliN/FliY
LSDAVAAAAAASVPPVDTEEITQADIDALMSAAGGGEPAPIAAPPASGPRVDSRVPPFDEAPGGLPAGAASKAPPAVTTQRYELPDLGPSTLDGVDVKRLTMLNDVKLRVKIELGRTRMLVEDVLKLGEGGVVELDKLAGDPVDVYANDRLIARGEVLVLNDSFCVRISEVVSRDPHRVSV